LLEPNNALLNSNIVATDLSEYVRASESEEALQAVGMRKTRVKILAFLYGTEQKNLFERFSQIDW
jgi:hypothetical protein